MRKHHLRNAITEDDEHFNMAVISGRKQDVIQWKATPTTAKK